MPQLQTQNFTDINGNTVRFLVTEANQIPYFEYMEYRESWKLDGVESTRICGCRWEDRYDFIRDMLGTATWSPGQNVGGVVSNLSRQVPEAHPEYQNSDGVGWMYATEAQLLDCQGMKVHDHSDIAKALSSSPDYGTLNAFDDNSYMVAFNIAKFSITYRPVDYFVYTDKETPADQTNGELERFVIKTYTYAAENLPIPGSAFWWVPTVPENRNQIPECPPKVFPTMELTYTWKNVPLPRIQKSDNIISRIGTVNSAAFDRGYWDVGTLLFVAPDIKPFRSPVGDYLYDIAFKFLYRATGHNFLYRGSVNAFREVSIDGTHYPQDDPTITGKHIYDSSDFSQLFVLPAQ
jgi:hypothetical protein